MTPKSDTAVFPGSFNPFTKGHASIVRRALSIFPRLVIAVGVNVNKPDADAEARIAEIRRLYSGNPRVEVVKFSGLTADLASRLGAAAIIRGVRGVADFEYERSIADINRRLAGIETILMYSLPELEAVSSSAVRELRHFGADTSMFIPKDENDTEI